MKSKAQDIIEVTIKWTYFRFTPVFLRRLPNAGLNPTWISKNIRDMGGNRDRDRESADGGPAARAPRAGPGRRGTGTAARPAGLYYSMTCQ